MKIKGSWLKVMGLAVSLPSTIFGLAWGMMELVKMNVFSKPVGFSIFLLIIAYTFYMMIYYARNKKD
ncbi:hypothetical protein OAT67_07475 [Bacteriovoracaceae bacterium]|nr:hypothetical protein [Bacteriovoracaceae bacterium]|tara:strand:+ start:125179 stop:125379 length:201 start_codon:yes stop_codon:yes gene_type:complete